MKEVSYQSSGIASLLGPNRMATGLLLLVNSALFLAVLLSKNEAFLLFAAKTLPGLAAGQWWRLLTAGYLHINPMHILMNMMSLYNLGPLAEEMFGTRRMFTIWTVSTICGFLLSAVWTPAPSIGASAGIFGLMGALIAAGVMSQHPYAKYLQQQLLINAGLGFLIGSLPMFPIDNAAHLGGMIGGFGTAWVARFPRPYDDAREKLWSLVSIVSLALTIYAFYEVATRVNQFAVRL